MKKAHTIREFITSYRQPKHAPKKGMSPQEKALATLGQMKGQLDTYVVKNTKIPKFRLNNAAYTKLLEGTNAKTETTAREKLRACIEARLQLNLIPVCDKSDEVKQNTPKNATIDIKDLLGEDGVSLFRDALAEEALKSRHFRRAILQESLLFEEGESCRERQMVVVGGASGSGKSSGGKKAFQEACKTAPKKRSKTRKGEGTHAIQVDGGLSREVSNTWGLLAQVSIDLGYTGVDLYPYAGVLEKVKDSLLEAACLDDKASIIYPDTFSNWFTVKSTIDKLAARGRLFYTRVDGDPAVLPYVIEHIANLRAFRADGKRPECKAYNKKGYAAGKKGSEFAQAYVQYQYPNTPCHIIPNDLVLATRTHRNSSWTIVEGKPKSGSEVVAVSKKIFDEFKAGDYWHREQPKSDKPAGEKNPDDILPVGFNIQNNRWELLEENSKDVFINQKHVIRVRRDFWDNLWPNTQKELDECDGNAAEAKRLPYRTLHATAVSLEAYSNFYRELPEIHHVVWFEVKTAVLNLQKLLRIRSDEFARRANEEHAKGASKGTRQIELPPELKKLNDSTTALIAEIQNLEKVHDLKSMNNLQLKTLSAQLSIIKHLDKELQDSVKAVVEAVKQTNTIMQQNTKLGSSILSMSLNELTAAKKNTGSFWERHRTLRDVLIGLVIFILCIGIILAVTAIVANTFGVGFGPLIVSLVTFGGFLPSIPVGIGTILTAGATIFASIAALAGDWIRGETEKEEKILMDKTIKEWTTQKINELYDPALDWDLKINLIKGMVPNSASGSPLPFRNSDSDEDSTLSSSGTSPGAVATSASSDDLEENQKPQFVQGNRQASLLEKNGIFSTSPQRIIVDNDEEEDDDVDYDCRRDHWVLV